MKGIETQPTDTVVGCRLSQSDHCPAMKGIETGVPRPPKADGGGSDHCPAMKGIETRRKEMETIFVIASDHCPAMKGIETSATSADARAARAKRPLPRNEGD